MNMNGISRRTELIFSQGKSQLLSERYRLFGNEGNERGFLLRNPYEHFAINGKMKTKHIRLCVRNTKNRLERKYERFSYIQNHEIRDNIRKSKKGNDNEQRQFKNIAKSKMIIF